MSNISIHSLIYPQIIRVSMTPFIIDCNYLVNRNAKCSFCVEFLLLHSKETLEDWIKIRKKVKKFSEYGQL